ncbi:unnamed protein product [marine sediment metagenome]|uniref:Uncharacterized protein n=1 Tax=marine sediment metagenome TaxID=412755 RepID=X0T3P6_9ZZZZ
MSNPGKCGSCGEFKNHLVQVSSHPEWHDDNYCEECLDKYKEENCFAKIKDQIEKDYPLEELSLFKPCPFCGTKTESHISVMTNATVLNQTTYRVICTQCNTDGPIYFTSEGAINKWNERS